MAGAKVGKPDRPARPGRWTPDGAALGIAMATLALMVGLGCREAGAAGSNLHSAGETVLAHGQVAFDDDIVAHVTSPVAGRVTSVLAQLGRRVAKGAPLAVITSPELARVVPDKLKAEADLAAAEGENQRQRQLFDAHEGMTDRLEAARAALALARARLERARANAALVKSLAADEMTGSFTLVAPIGGVVLASAAAPGAVVAGQGPGGGAPDLFTVGTLDRVWVIARISAADLARVRVGARVTVQVAALPGKTFAGRVARLSAPGPASHEAAVRCAVANAGGVLRPGMAATVVVAAAARATTWGS
jgi:cobalt-zinc-cadmium efflux system membrane fusion protein